VRVSVEDTTFAQRVEYTLEVCEIRFTHQNILQLARDDSVDKHEVIPTQIENLTLSRKSQFSKRKKNLNQSN
jgi:hypothetical protein